MITTEDGHMLTTVGLDLGDKTIQACVVDHHGEIVDGIEVSLLDSSDVVLAKYRVDKGTWVDETDGPVDTVWS